MNFSFDNLRIIFNKCTLKYKVPPVTKWKVDSEFCCYTQNL